MTALTLCVSAAQKDRSVRPLGLERMRGDSATAVSFVLTDLTLLEEGDQSLTIHLD